jgi:hypothetical protein
MRIVCAIAWAVAGLSATPAAAEILFARGSAVPPAVQEFAWHAIETRCDHQAFERAQRSFWAYRTRAERVDGATVYSIQIVSEVGWRRADPPAFVEMTVADEGALRLAALRSSFIRCVR